MMLFLCSPGLYASVSTFGITRFSCSYLAFKKSAIEGFSLDTSNIYTDTLRT